MTDHGAGAEDRDDSAIVIPLHHVRREREQLPVTFHRRELDMILRIYGEMVAAGEWRDYAMDFTRDAASFSAFRRAAERPQARIEKRPALRGRQGMWTLFGEAGQVLKRGHELAGVLSPLERRLMKLVED